MNIDIVAENSVSHQSFLSPLHAALQVVLAVPPLKLDRCLVYLLIQKSLPIFPLLVLKLLRKCWGPLTSEQQTELLKCAIARLSYTQDSEIPSILCQLFIQLHSDEMPDSRRQLEFFVTDALDHPNPIAGQYRAVFQAFLYFVRREKPGADWNLEDSISAFAPAIFQSVFGRPDDRTQKAEPLSDSAPPTFQFVPFDAAVLHAKLPVDAPLVKVQLSRPTCVFSQENLQQLYQHYCSVDDRHGIAGVLRYAMSKQIPVDIDRTKVPSCALVPVTRYLATRNAPEAPALISICAQSLLHEVRMASITADPNQYLQSIRGLQRLTKEHLTLFATATSTVTFDPDLLQKALMRCLELGTHKKILPYLLALAAVVLSV